MNKLPKLPVKVTGDAQGISTYPVLLLRFGASETLHLATDGSYGPALCGISSNGRPVNLVDYVGTRAFHVCARCRGSWDAGR